MHPWHVLVIEWNFSYSIAPELCRTIPIHSERDFARTYLAHGIRSYPFANDITGSLIVFLTKLTMGFDWLYDFLSWYLVCRKLLSIISFKSTGNGSCLYHSNIYHHILVFSRVAFSSSIILSLLSMFFRHSLLAVLPLIWLRLFAAFHIFFTISQFICILWARQCFTILWYNLVINWWLEYFYCQFTPLACKEIIVMAFHLVHNFCTVGQVQN